MLPRIFAMGRFPFRKPPPDDEYYRDQGEKQEEGEDTTANDDKPTPFYPSLFEVLEARYLLQWKVVEGGLPVELVDLIIDEAEYWASTKTKRDRKTMVRADCDRVLLRTEPLCYERTPQGPPRLLPHRTIHPCRKIVFSIAAHDQGWGGGPGTHGKYLGSYTWFDAETIPFSEYQATEEAEEPPTGRPRAFGADDPHLLPTRDKLQSNPTAIGDTQQYNITWHYQDDIEAGSTEAEEIERLQGRGRTTLDGQRVREMGLGDSMAVWGRARFGGWTNHVEQLSVRVFWAI